MTSEKKTLMVFGAGKLGGPVVDLLASRYPGHRYVLICRSADIAERRINLTRYVCSQWGSYPELHWEAADLMNTEQIVTLILQYQPDIIFNATTPFAWWLIDELPDPLMRLSTDPGMECGAP